MQLESPIFRKYGINNNQVLKIKNWNLGSRYTNEQVFFCTLGSVRLFTDKWVKMLIQEEFLNILKLVNVSPPGGIVSFGSIAVY